jgi:cytoskeletal protein CcmA (bactofilin family)
MGENTTTNEIVYTVPDGERTVVYPDKEFTNVLGTVYLPRIYGKELSYLEIGSSGKIAVTLTDIHSFDIANSSNVVYFNATTDEKFAFVPKDTQKTVSLGEFSSFSSNNYQQFDTTESQGFNFLDNVRFNGTTITAGNATVQSDLLVNGHVDVDKTLQVTGEVSFSNNLNVQQNLDVNGTADVLGTTMLRDTLQTVGAASFSNTMYVAGDTTLESHLQVNDDVDVTGTMQVTGEVSLSNNLNVQQNLDVNGTADVLGTTLLRDTLQTVGAASFSNTMYVAGDTTLESHLQVNDDVDVTGTMQVTGEVSLSNNLNVAQNLDVNGTADILGTTLLRDTLQTVGAASFSNTMYVAGDTTLESHLQVNDDVDITGTMQVTGEVSLSNNLNVAQNLDVNGTADILGATILRSDAQVVGAVTLSNTLLVEGATDLNSTLDVLGATILRNDAQVVGAVTLSNTLLVEGAADLNSTLDVLGATILRNDAQVVGAVTLSNTLLVEGNTDLNGTLDVLKSTLLRDTLQTVGATSLSNTLNVTSTTTLQSNLIVNGGSLFQLDSRFNSTVTISNLVVTDTVSFTGDVPSIFENLTVNGVSQFNGLIYTHADVGMSNDLTVAGSTDIKTNLLVEGSTQLVGAVSLSNVLNVDGVSTFNDNVVVGVNDAGVDVPTKFLGIGTASPNISLDVGDRTDGIALPVGTTAERPTGEDGIIRYNSEINRFEGYGNAAWSGLGGVVDVNQDTYILAENSPNANNDQLRFYTSNAERMIILSTGNVGVGQTTDPTSGNKFWVQGNSYFNSTEVRMNNNLTVEQTATIRNITATHDSTMQANLTVNNTLFVDSISDPTVINVTAPTINLNGNVAITGSLETINTETITVEDKLVVLASAGQSSSNIYTRDGGLNTQAGFKIEGIPDGFDATASNVKYYEKSLTWNFGGSNGVASLAQSTNALDDCYYSLKNGSLLIERYSSNFGMNYTDGSSIPVTSIGFMLRINSNEALEVVKIREDENGVRTASVVSRFGIQLPSLVV